MIKKTLILIVLFINFSVSHAWAYHGSSKCPSWRSNDVFHELSTIQGKVLFKKCGIPTNEVDRYGNNKLQYQNYLKKKLGDKAFIQFEKIINDNSFEISSVRYILKLGNDKYLLFYGFPDIVAGIYPIILPQDLTTQPTISDRISYASELVDIIQEKDNIWLVVYENRMKNGYGSSGYSLISLNNPEKVFVLETVEYLSEERGSEMLLTLPGSHFSEEINRGMETVSEFIDYNLANNCISLTTSSINLTTKKTNYYYYYLSK